MIGLRIKKILHFYDDDFDPAVTETFDYDANGLLKSIIHKNKRGGESLIKVEYNEEKQPIKILSYGDNVITVNSYSIGGNNTGFIAKYLEYYGNRVECVLDSRNQIVSSKYHNFVSTQMDKRG